MTKSVDTIAAVATPKGRGGIAIIRVSGPLVPLIIETVLAKSIKAKTAYHLPFYDHDGSVIDQGIALYFPNPHSFTGEDVLELHGHGGPVIVDLLLTRILRAGARLAEPGEFSLRAFLNDKIDLTQAEAIADLIDASSVEAARSAMRSLQGAFSQAVNKINQCVINLRTLIEAGIDFSDEDITFLQHSEIKKALEIISINLNDLEKQSQQGSRLRDGIHVVIVGKPNVGKSSLLNRLSGKEIAIVTDIPGTTRDIVRDDLLMDGIPLHVQDTAGLRDSEDIVEAEGIKRAKAAIAKADIVLYVFDKDGGEAISEIEIDQRYLFIRNKIDLFEIKDSSLSEHVILLSAKTGVGIEQLKTAIKNKIGFDSREENLFLARRRHLEALARAKQHIIVCLQDVLTENSEIVAEELRLAQLALASITGEFSADDLLGNIFASFCIGK